MLSRKHAIMLPARFGIPSIMVVILSNASFPANNKQKAYCLRIISSRSVKESVYYGRKLTTMKTNILILYFQETPKRILLKTVNTQMNAALCCISSESTLSVKVKKIFRQKNSIFFLICNLTLLDMYNGLSQAYCIESEGRIY